MDAITEQELRSKLADISLDVLDEVVSIWTYPDHALTNLWIERIFEALPMVDTVLVDGKEQNPSFDLVYSSMWGDGWTVDGGNVGYALWRYGQKCGFVPRPDCMTNLKDLREKVDAFYEAYARKLSEDLDTTSDEIRSILVKVGLVDDSHPEYYDVKVEGA